jgi:hypothetical protein
MKFFVFSIIFSLASSGFAKSVGNILSTVTEQNCNGENSREISILDLKTKLENLDNTGRCKVYDTKYYSHIKDSVRVTAVDGADVALLIVRFIDDVDMLNGLTSEVLLMRGEAPLCVSEKDGVETISYDFNYQSGEYSLDNWKKLFGEGIHRLVRKSVLQIANNNLVWMGVDTVESVDSFNLFYAKFPEFNTYQCGQYLASPLK